MSIHHHHLLPSINDLPIELLVSILKVCVDNCNPITLEEHPPWRVLMSICRLWTQILLSMPNCWTNIRVDLTAPSWWKPVDPELESDDSWNVRKHLTRQLELSQTCPVSLSIISHMKHGSVQPDFTDFFTAVVELEDTPIKLKTYSELENAHGFFWWLLPVLSKQEYQHLTHVRFKAPTHFAYIYDEIIVERKSEIILPNLTTMYMDGIANADEVLKYLKAPQLRELIIPNHDYLTLESFIHFIRTCPTLKRLTFSPFPYDPSIWDPSIDAKPDSRPFKHLPRHLGIEHILLGEHSRMPSFDRRNTFPHWFAASLLDMFPNLSSLEFQSFRPWYSHIGTRPKITSVGILDVSKSFDYHIREEFGRFFSSLFRT